jgi:hypothetical protein
METIREYIKRRMRRAFLFAVIGWASMPLTALIAGGKQLPWQMAIIPIVGMALFFSGIFVSLRLRCPRCQSRLGQIAWPIAVPVLKPIPNYCPYCGVSLDEQRAADPSRREPAATSELYDRFGTRYPKP